MKKSHKHIFRDEVVLALVFIAIVILFGGMIHKIMLTESSKNLAAVYAKVLVDITNEDRESRKVGLLVENPILVEAARLKAEDMASKGYFAHYAPDGTAPWDWMKKAGYEYTLAGENLAVNFSDSWDVADAWMNSPTHRSNVLNANFTEIGIATAKGKYKGRSTVFVVQMFGHPVTTNVSKPQLSNPNPALVIESIITNPRLVAFALYTIIFIIVAIGLISWMLAEFHERSRKHFWYAIAILAALVGCAYLYNLSITSYVMIV